jgi:hypothetical protein
MIAQPRNIGIVVLALVGAADVFIPVGPELWIGRGHDRLALALVQALLVVELPGRPIILERRQRAGLQATVLPAATDAIPLARVADAGAGFDVVPVHVFGAVAVGPQLLAGDRAGVAAEALVEVHHHCVLVV